ncbi:hypothetical protein FRB90_004793 [Tulasnella sp. 427]|nr:hypothetical protein FRB90_004793 [Tulasnella sp. 427]
MLVVSSDCKNCTGPFFDPSQSSTFVDTQQDFFTSFVDGSSTTGTVSTDIVSMGSLTVQTQAFALVTQASEGFDGPNAGLIGLGFESEAQSKATPWFINLSNAGALESNVFSFYMSRESAEGSELCVGCYDSSKFSGDIEYFPLYPGGSSQKNWDITASRAQGLTVGGQVVTSNFTATIDSGTSKIIVPPSVAEALYSQIPGAEPEDGVYVVPCSSAPSLEVGISFSSATVFNIAPSELVVSTPVDSGSDKCIALIISSGSEDGMVLIGDTFISSWYSVFDYGNQKIGFAKAN